MDWTLKFLSVHRKIA
jgi:hypothetical protein